MKSIRIDFKASGCSLVLDETVEGFEAVAQNGMVNIVTAQGSDPGFPKRGTTLLVDALQGRMASLLASRHASELAAIDTLFFLRESDAPGTTEERAESVGLQPLGYDGTELELNAYFEGTNGTKVGYEITL